MRKHTFTEDQTAAMVAKYRAGTSAINIAVEHGVDWLVIRRILREQGVFEAGRKFSGRLTAAQRDEIVARYSAGETQGALAKEYGCNRANVHYILKSRGVTFRKPRDFPPTAEQVQQLRSKRAEGLNYTEIARALGVPPHRAQRWGAELGLPTLNGRQGADSPCWQGGRRQDANGYWHVRIQPDDPLRAMVPRSQYAPEHRVVMARSLGRPLTRSETVHHINGVKDDNRLENLQLRTGNHGKGASFTCADCGSHNVVPTRLAG